MQLTYFNRFRMQIDLGRREIPPSPLPPGYYFVPWNEKLLDAFADVKYRSFRDELDANVFPCLGERDGCRRLMNEIRRKPGFLPEATWLIAHQPPPKGPIDYCGTVQGIRDRRGVGAIQNIGIAPEHRGHGLGSCLVYQSLRGFRRAGLLEVYLEVTSHNQGAIRLYQRLGFETTRTVFKSVEIACTG
jgi:hypothetical protein